MSIIYLSGDSVVELKTNIGGFNGKVKIDLKQNPELLGRFNTMLKDIGFTQDELEKIEFLQNNSSRGSQNFYTKDGNKKPSSVYPNTLSTYKFHSDLYIKVIKDVIPNYEGVVYAKFSDIKHYNKGLITQLELKVKNDTFDGIFSSCASDIKYLANEIKSKLGLSGLIEGYTVVVKPSKKDFWTDNTYKITYNKKTQAETLDIANRIKSSVLGIITYEFREVYDRM